MSEPLQFETPPTEAVPFRGKSLVQQDRQEALATIDPMALLARAIDRGVDPNQLEKLMDLQERFERNHAIKAFNGAMSKCQAELPAVVRTKCNRQTNSMYAPLESINEWSKPIITKNGLSLIYGEDVTANKEGFARLWLEVHHDAGHTVRVEGDFPLDGVGIKGNPMMTAIHSKGSTITYARRYLLCMAFNISVADDDKDGNATFVPKITETEVMQINDLIHDLIEAGKWNDDRQRRFMAWLEVEKLEELPKAKVEAAMEHLNKLKGGKK